MSSVETWNQTGQYEEMLPTASTRRRVADALPYSAAARWVPTAPTAVMGASRPELST